jgi:ABC-2 type transport system ATP-binding protein
MTALIEARDVHFLYRRSLLRGPIRALDGFNLDVRQGDIFGLLGPNGAGKSTAMYCLLGLLRPAQGSIRVLGRAPEAGAPYLDRVAYLPEEPHYHLFLTVEEAVTFYASLYRTDAPRQRVRAALERVGLAEFRDLRLSKCSKGMKQKAGIAACMVAEPEVLFLDEPTRGLDPIIVKELRDILEEMNRGGATIILNSHVLSEVEMVSNRVAIMRAGRVLVQDELSNLLKLDHDQYEVVLEPGAGTPDFLTVLLGTSNGELEGLVPVERIRDLFAWAEEQNRRVIRCALKRLTLEEVFMEAMNRS